MITRVARVSWKGEARHVAFDDDGEGGDFALLDGSLAAGFACTGVLAPRLECRLLTPVTPTKIVGVGANFAGDEEPPSREVPSLFLMPPSALVACGDDVRLPAGFGSVLVEGELGVVIGKRCTRLSRDDVTAVIAGFTIVNDLSGRDATLSFVPPALKKGSDGFVPLGPCIALAPASRDWSITSFVNGALCQQGHMKDAFFDVESVVALLSNYMTLEVGDIISMGTPPPKPKAKAGDVMRVTIPGIGTLENRIA